MSPLLYQISVVVGLLLGLLLLLQMFGINLNEPSTPKKLIEVATIETMENMDHAHNFCKSYEGNSFELNKKCKELTVSNCQSTNCCIMYNGVCSAGNAKYGVTYK